MPVPPSVPSAQSVAPSAPAVPLTLLTWRRAVAALYADVRSHVAAGGDPADAHRRWREGRDALFAEHPDSPIPARSRAGFAGLAYAPYDAQLRWTLPVLGAAGPELREVPTGTDGVVRFERRGRVELPDGRGGLDLWWLLGYGGGLFVPVKDASSGRTSYGGGRYLLDTVKGADLGGSADGAELVIDLNFAYQPSCAYDPAWACPLASPGNTVPGDIQAGELYRPERYGGTA
jgi:uncharacterized protein